MLIDFTKHSDQNYFTLIQAVVPRPIAWVLSDHGNGAYNLAPFSFFNAVTSNPPIIMLSMGWKDETTRKDTWVNIQERSHFVVHIPSVEHLKDVAGSAVPLDHGISEIDHLKISLEKVEGQALPRLKSAKVALFCERHSIQELGNASQALILGLVTHIWLDNRIVKESDGRLTIDPKELDPLARLGGALYAPLGEIITMKRPE